MKTIARQQLHYSGKSLSADASSVDIKPGEWPEQIKVIDADGRDPDRVFHRKMIKRDRDGNVQFARYQSHAGRLLVIINDWTEV